MLTNIESSAFEFLNTQFNFFSGKYNLMAINKSQNNNLFAEYHADLKEDGFHIFSKKKSKIIGFYPKEFPKYDEEIDISSLKKGDIVTIRAFFLVSKVPVFQADGGYIDLEIEFIDGETIWGNILTELPPQFPLAKGTSIELSIDEIMNVVK